MREGDESGQGREGREMDGEYEDRVVGGGGARVACPPTLRACVLPFDMLPRTCGRSSRGVKAAPEGADDGEARHYLH